MATHGKAKKNEPKPTNRPVLNVIVLGFDAVEIQVPPVLRREQIPALIKKLREAELVFQRRDTERARGYFQKAAERGQNPT